MKEGQGALVGGGVLNYFFREATSRRNSSLYGYAIAKVNGDAMGVFLSVGDSTVTPSHIVFSNGASLARVKGSLRATLNSRVIRNDCRLGYESQEVNSIYDSIRRATIVKVVRRYIPILKGDVQIGIQSTRFRRGLAYEKFCNGGHPSPIAGYVVND